MVVVVREAARGAVTEEAHRLVSELHLETPTPDGATNGALLDAIGSRELADGLLRIMRDGSRIASEHGFLAGQLFEARSESLPESELEPRFAAFEWHYDKFELPPMATRVPL